MPDSVDPGQLLLQKPNDLDLQFAKAAHDLGSAGPGL